MAGSLKDKKLGMIHLAAFTVQVVDKFIKEIIPEVTVAPPGRRYHSNGQQRG